MRIYFDKCTSLSRGFASLAVLCALPQFQTGIAVQAAEPAATVNQDFSAELPRIQPLEPDEALKTFEVLDGFRIQRMAAEPLVASPVAMSFDENGRLFVVEMIDYSEQDHDNLGQIRMLEDLDQDGVFDKSTVLTDGLSWPTAIICYDGGVFVGAAPDLWYFKDTDGDGKADIKRKVYTGFGRSNVQGLMNCFRWGLDNRIHGASSSSGGVVKQVDRPEVPEVTLRGRDFSFDPVTLELKPESGGGQHGMYFNDWGEKFVCANSNHAQFITFDDRYIARNPYLRAPSPRVDIAIDGGQGPVFRTSPIEPWRIVRTRLRVSGQVPGAVEGGGRAGGYFTGATGIIIYRGDQLGDRMKGLAIVGDVGSNIVHRKQLIPKGVSYEARRIDNQTEFVRSTDIWFRPVQFDNSPDGCLLILDMYREMIEHPHSIPPEIKKHLDTSSGQKRGRLYRIIPPHYTYRPTPHVGELTSAQLVELLAHDNSWHRETASRMLFQRQDPSIVPQLKTMVRESDKPLGRLHAMSTLSGLKALDSETTILALRDAHPGVRRRALEHAEQFAADEAVASAVGQLTKDKDLKVRYQLAFTAGEFNSPQQIEWLREILLQDGQDPLVQVAAQSSVGEDSGALLAELWKDEAFRKTPGTQVFLGKLVEQIAREKSVPEIQRVLTLLSKLPEAEITLQDAMFQRLLEQGGSTVAAAVAKGEWHSHLETMLQRSRDTLQSKQPANIRVAAINTLRFSTAPGDVELLAKQLAPNVDVNVQRAALKTLSMQQGVDMAAILLKPWKELLPPVRLQAEEILFSRPQWTDQVLKYLESGQWSLSMVSPQRLQLLAKGSQPDFKARAQKLLDSTGATPRGQVVQQYATALELTGDRDRGRALFRAQCITCHRLEDTGFAIGPDLSSIRNRGKQVILLNVLDPNREVNPEFLNYLIALEDGRGLTGMIRSETATSLNLLRAGNQSDQVLLNEIEQIHNSGLSLMPEGLEKQINEQAMADLITYLMTFDAPVPPATGSRSGTGQQD